MANSSLKHSQLLLALFVMAALLALASVNGDSYAHDVVHPKGGYDKHLKHGGYYKAPKKDVDDVSNKPAPFKLPRLVSLAVEGVVSCQDCKYVGTKSLTDAKPLAGAKVKLVCQAGPRYKTFYTTATTDKNGFFFLRVPHFDFHKFTPLDDCAILLLSSPLRKCSNPTTINYSKTGASLRPIPTFAPSSEAFFSVGPLAFAPQPCIKLPPIDYPPPSPATPKNPPPYAFPAPTTPTPPPAY